MAFKIDQESYLMQEGLAAQALGAVAGNYQKKTSLDPSHPFFKEAIESYVSLLIAKAVISSWQNFRRVNSELKAEADKTYRLRSQRRLETANSDQTAKFREISKKIPWLLKGANHMIFGSKNSSKKKELKETSTATSEGGDAVSFQAHDLLANPV